MITINDKSYILTTMLHNQEKMYGDAISICENVYKLETIDIFGHIQKRVNHVDGAVVYIGGFFLWDKLIDITEVTLQKVLCERLVEKEPSEVIILFQEITDKVLMYIRSFKVLENLHDVIHVCDRCYPIVVHYFECNLVKSGCIEFDCFSGVISSWSIPKRYICFLEEFGYVVGGNVCLKN